MQTDDIVKKKEKCRLCGLCCYYFKNGKKTKCKYLKKIGSLFVCRIYSTHVGTIIDKVDGGMVIVCTPFNPIIEPYKSVCPRVKTEQTEHLNTQTSE